MRTEQQISDERKRLSDASKVLIARPDNPAYWLNLGAWLALVWIMDRDDKAYPLAYRLQNAERAPNHNAGLELTVNDAPNLPQSKSRNPPFEERAK